MFRPCCIYISVFFSFVFRFLLVLFALIGFISLFVFCWFTTLGQWSCNGMRTSLMKGFQTPFSRSIAVHWCRSITEASSLRLSNKEYREEQIHSTASDKVSEAPPVWCCCCTFFLPLFGVLFSLHGVAYGLCLGLVAFILVVSFPFVFRFLLVLFALIGFISLFVFCWFFTLGQWSCNDLRMSLMNGFQTPFARPLQNTRKNISK